MRKNWPQTWPFFTTICVPFSLLFPLFYAQIHNRFARETTAIYRIAPYHFDSIHSGCFIGTDTRRSPVIVQGADHAPAAIVRSIWLSPSAGLRARDLSGCTLAGLSAGGLALARAGSAPPFGAPPVDLPLARAVPPFRRRPPTRRSTAISYGGAVGESAAIKGIVQNANEVHRVRGRASGPRG
jgi:hypothetical protein